MLIRDNLRIHFYENLKEQGHCLVLVNTDVDAICAWTILESLFRCDEFSYSVLAVAGTEDFETKLQEHSQTTKTILLINCGGNRAISDLQIAPDCRIFIVDSRRPFHHENVYDDSNVRVVVDAAELERLAIPSVSDIYENETDSEDEEDENMSDDENYDRRQSHTDKIERRAAKDLEKRIWKQNRMDKLWKYYENAWFSISSAVVMFQLAHECSKSCPEGLWCAGVGLASQLNDCLISVDFYYETCIDKLRTFLRRFAPHNGLEDKSGQLFRLKFGKELTLPFYAHWSLYESMLNDENFVIRNHMWSQKGKDRLHLNLASLGLTLLETRQVFHLMDRERRNEVFNILYEDQHSEHNIQFSTFTAQFDYNKPYNAVDFARALAVRLEYGQRGPLHEPIDDRFRAAASVLDRFMNGKGSDEMAQIVESAKEQLKATVDLAIQTVKQQNVTPSGGFILVRVNTVTEAGYVIASRHSLFTFARLVQNAYAHKSTHKDRKRKPLIFVITLTDDLDGWTLVTGLMPLDAVDAESKKSVIGRAFEQTIERTRVEAVQKTFDSSIILLNTHHRLKFLDGLQVAFS
ncbi:hypothetical protein QR680_014793 [Steinernema hermaphroditum]|uniref:CDC45-like protein n=1 Tax=Steinernema hermaphroditum TaxID=289476 RepID=A0AA39ICB4_9BILA|nr:hypothetical protein QR680_014793 [Steinernema hermaphroditum]